mmetsp:Transcript_21125/g.54092  ORF Transcript_21125/g.54092 Transcript_21125/m.54092 type:complete len:157 (+) Transcript_21125:1094-1564(+)
MRERCWEQEDGIRQTKDELLASKQSSYHEVSTAVGPNKVREFKAQERARKAQNSARMRQESRINLDRARMAFEDEDARKRRLHDAVRRAATDGYGDLNKTAYSSFMHSGTSLNSSARHDGQHAYKHDLPSARSPLGKWIRDYASATTPRLNSVVSV